VEGIGSELVGGPTNFRLNLDESVSEERIEWAKDSDTPVQIWTRGEGVDHRGVLQHPDRPNLDALVQSHNGCESLKGCCDRTDLRANLHGGRSQRGPKQ